jgi:hypothetical protein
LHIIKTLSNKNAKKNPFLPKGNKTGRGLEGQQIGVGEDY